MKDKNQFNENMALLRDKYLARLGSTVSKLESYIATLSHSADDCNNVQALQNILDLTHKMAGSAGSYSLANLSSMASSMEMTAMGLLSGHGSLQDSDIETLTNLFNNLAAEISFDLQQKVIVEPFWKGYTDSWLNVEEDVKSIVMVDDDRAFVNLMAVQLLSYGFVVVPLQDHRQLQKVIETQSPAAVVINVVFPDGVDVGVDTISALRSAGVLQCPVVFLSVRDDLVARLGAVRSDSDAFFHKPVDVNEFAGTLSRLTKKIVDEDYRVVLVDDDIESANVIALYLNDAGVITKTVNNPLDAMANIRALDPDVILLDINMPVCNGFELARVIRQHDDYLQIPIVFLTARETQEDWLKVMQVGGDDFLRKSILPNELVTDVVSRAKRARRLKRLTRKLSISESRFRSVAQTARDAIVTTDGEGRIVTWNRSATSMFGYSENDIRGSQLMNLFTETTLNWQTDEFKVVEMTGERSDGDEIPMEISKSNWQVGDEDYFTFIIRDNRRRKQHEKSLRQAKALAENSNQAKTEFLSAMSHELRTPLNSILGFSQLLKINLKEPLTSTQESSVVNIIKGGRYLLELINDILDLAKIEAGKVTLSMQSIKADQILRECTSYVSHLAEARKITLVTADFTGECLFADYMRLKQTLLNLLTNAIKYGRQGGRVTVDGTRITGNLMRIFVTDDGIGIAENRQHELFLPFSRLGAETTEVEGTGIGLSVTKKLAQMMGGNVGFESVEAKGSKFWIDIPLFIQSASTANSPLDTLVKPKRKEKTSLGSVHGKVLYVEDNRANLKLMEQVVAKMVKPALISAKDAETGIELANRDKPSLIFMDINLPGMSGLEALRVLKGNKLTAHIPIIAMSAAALPQNIEEGLKSGFLRYLTKPIDIDEVIEIIEQIVC